MKISITIDGVTRNWKGTAETLSVNDWTEKMQSFIDDVNNYNK